MEKSKFDFKFLNKMMYVGAGIILLYVLKNLGILSKIGNILVSLTPVYIGIIICWISSPLAKKLKKFGLKDRTAAVVSLIIIFGIFVLIFSIAIPMLVSELANLITDLPDIYTNVVQSINEFLNTHFNISKDQLLNVSKNQTTIDLVRKYLSNILSYSITTIQSVINIIVGVFTTIVVSFFLVKDIDKFKTNFINFLTKGKKNTRKYKMIVEIGEVFRSYVKGVLLDSFIVGIMMTVICLILKIKYAIIFGILIMFLNLIPYIGALFSELIVSLFALSTGGIGFAILTFALALLIQIIDANILQPNIVAKSVNLHPVVVLSSLIIFNILFGIFGMVIALPVMAMLKIVLKYVTNKDIDEKQVEQIKE